MVVVVTSPSQQIDLSRPMARPVGPQRLAKRLGAETIPMLQTLPLRNTPLVILPFATLPGTGTPEHPLNPPRSSEEIN